MSAPNSEPSDTLKGDESNKSDNNGAQEFNAESSHELNTPETIREILNDHGNVLNEQGTKLTLLQQQNHELKEIVTDIREQITKLINLYSWGESLKQNPETAQHPKKEESSTSKKSSNGSLITRHTEESSKAEKAIIDVNDSGESPDRGSFDRTPLTKSKENLRPRATSQPEAKAEIPGEQGSGPFETTTKYTDIAKGNIDAVLIAASSPQSNHENSEIVADEKDFKSMTVARQSEQFLTDDLSQMRSTTISASGESEANAEPEHNFTGDLSKMNSTRGSANAQLQAEATPKLEDNVKGDNGSKVTCASRIPSSKASKPTGSDLTNSIRSVTNGSDASKTKTIEVVQSHLKTIEVDWGRLQQLFKEDEKEFGNQLVNDATTLQAKWINTNDCESANSWESTGVLSTEVKKSLLDDKGTQNKVSLLKTSPEKLCFLCNKVATLPPCENCSSNEVLPEVEIPAYCGKAHKDLHRVCGHDKNYCGIKTSELGWKEVRGTEGINNGLPYYVATRDLPPGHHIFTKKPLVTIPRKIQPHEYYAFGIKFRTLGMYMQMQELGPNTCFICCELMLYGELIEDPLHGIRMNKCLDCGWPVHSPPHDPEALKLCRNSCQKKHEMECKIFVKKDLTWDKVQQYSLLSLGVLRAVLDPIVRQKLLALPFRTGPEPHFEVVHELVRKACDSADVSDEDLRKIIHVICSNNLPSSPSFVSIRNKYALTIYEGGHTGRILPHDCNPNCSILVNPITGEATFQTRRAIKRDEMLTINYVVDAFPQPIDQRARYLRQLLIHHCNCSKCKDGQDLTSTMKQTNQENTESLKKHKKGCRSKYLMPFSTSRSISTQEKPNANKQEQVNFDVNNLYIWQCQSCKITGPRMGQSDVEQKVETIRKQIWGLFYRSNIEKPYQGLKNIVDKHSDVDLHPDHSILLLAQVTLGNLAVEQMRIKWTGTAEKKPMDVPTRRTYFEYLDKAIQMLERTDKGQSEVYGTLLYYHTLLWTRNRAEMYKKLKTIKGSELLKFSESALSKLEESWDIIKSNPYLSVVEISRDIGLCKVYTKELEKCAKNFPNSIKGPIFKAFLLKQEERLRIAQESPNEGAWYLCRVKPEGEEDSIERMNADIPGFSGAVEAGNLVKKELYVNRNAISGAFIRELGIS